MRTRFFLIFILFSLFLFYTKKKNKTISPIPAEYLKEKGENEKFIENRKKWIESMHKAAPGTNWKEMDNSYRRKINNKILHIRKSLVESNNLSNNKIFKDNFRNISGHWVEKGSNNLAGRMLTVDYDYQNDVLYGASQGGNIWKGDLGGNWECSLNDYIQFNNIQAVKVLHIQDTTRIVVAQETPAILFYTDNEGLSWNTYQGFPESGNIIRFIAISPQRMYLAKNQGTQIIVYRYQINDNSFHSVAIFSSYSKRFDIWTDKNITGLFVINANQLSYIDDNDNQVSQIGTINLDFQSSQIQKTILTGSFANNFTYLYVMYRAYNDAYIYQSTNGGVSWEYKSHISNDYLIPFTKNSFSCSSLNPENVYAGGMECFRSNNGGETFTKVNNWWEYYNNPHHKLHADLPEIRSFSFEEIVEYQLISTDGGIFISSDNLHTVTNISMNGLRVSQYYSTYTNRNNPDSIYAGSQDQGLQVSINGSESPADFIQIISGDYGHLVSGDNGNSFWAIYPGFVIFYPDHNNLTEYETCNFDINNNFLWMPPLCEDPVNHNKAWLGGGGTNGSSHLYEIKYQNQNLTFIEHEYNFAGESISAIGYSKVNPNYRYVLTQNGKFFFSIDNGENWEQTQQSLLPHAHYFYGSTIVTSNIDPELVFIGGSGYSNPPVYVSYNHGISFEAFSDSLPNTLVYQLSISDDDNYLFAATEVGPFALDLNTNNIWENIRGVSAPDQVYWSVDYIPQLRIARFGTYGRGIWDFVLDENNSTEENNMVIAPISIKAYPNPFLTSTTLVIQNIDKSIKHPILEIYNLKGQLIKKLKIKSNKTFWDGKNKNNKKIAAGLYLCKLKDKNKTLSVKKIIKLK